MRLTLVAAAALIDAEEVDPTADDRVLSGLALPYGADGRTSAGLVRASIGTIRWAPELRRLKVFAGHDRDHPVGYVTALTEDAAGLHVQFRLGNTPDGNRALIEAREGTRDAISVELEDVDLSEDGTILAATLAGIALVPLPAFSDARIAAEDTTPPADPDPDTDDTEDTEDDTDEQEGTVPAGSTTTQPTPGSTLAARAPADLAAARGRRPRQLTLEAACAQVAAQFAASDRSAAALTAALANVTPVSTGSASMNPPQWLGEIWTPEYVQLDWANAISAGVLTSMSLTGFKRLPPGPVISPYAGNKAPIPSDATLSFGPVTVAAKRHAVGADFDRIWIDFGDESVINTWLRLVAQDYAKKLDAAIGTAIIAEATDAGTAANVIAAVSLAAQTLKRAGASVNYIAIASDLYAQYLAITTADAPWWLAQSSAVDLSGTSASVNNLKIFESVDLADSTVVAGDRRAVTQYTPRGNPFTVRAVDLANGGLDVGVFGYSAELVNDPLGVVTVSVVTVP